MGGRENKLKRRQKEEGGMYKGCESRIKADYNRRKEALV